MGERKKEAPKFKALQKALSEAPRMRIFLCACVVVETLEALVDADTVTVLFSHGAT